MEGGRAKGLGLVRMEGGCEAVMLVLEKGCKILCGKNDNHHHGQIDLHYFAMTFKNDGPHRFDILTLSSMV